MKRFVRFNAQQAVLLDILLIVAGPLDANVSRDRWLGADRRGWTAGGNHLFQQCVFVQRTSAAPSAPSVRPPGREIKLPLIGDAAEMQQPR